MTTTPKEVEYPWDAPDADYGQWDAANAVSLVVIQMAEAKARRRWCWMVTDGELPHAPDYCERGTMTEDEREASDGCPQCEGE